MSVVSAGLSVAIYVYFFIVFVWVCAWLIGAPDMEALRGVKHLFPCGSIDNTPGRPLFGTNAFVWNLCLASLFAITHSFFARQPVKRALGHQDGSFYRPLYVLKSTAIVHLILHSWSPLMNGAYWWNINGGVVYQLLLCGNMFGVLYLLSATFALDHFSLFGVTQGTGFDLYASFGIKVEGFSTRLHYAHERHPIMTGFLIMFWTTPKMTYTHAMFAALCSGYAVLAPLIFEERDLIAEYPKEYPPYMARTQPFFGFCPLFSGIAVGAAQTKQD